jgi:hypothetical protein
MFIFSSASFTWMNSFIDLILFCTLPCYKVDLVVKVKDLKSEMVRVILSLTLTSNIKLIHYMKSAVWGDRRERIFRL